MKKIVIAAVAVLVLLVAAMFCLPYFVDINQYRGQIQAQLQGRLHRPVKLGAMSLGVFPVRVAVKDVSIGEDPRIASKVPFAQVGEMDVSVRLLPLLGKSIEIDSLNLKHPQIELIKDRAGVWNFASLGQEPVAPTSASKAASGAPPASPPPAAKPASTSGGTFSLGKLTISDGQIAVTDLQKSQPRAVYDHIDLTLEDFAADRQFKVDLAAHLPGRGAEIISLRGKAGPLQQSEMLATPFDGTLKLDEVSLTGAQKFLNVAALQDSDAVISGSTNVANTNGKVAAKGSLKITDAVVHKVEVGYAITLDFDISDDLKADLLEIRQGNMKLGSMPLSVSGTLNTHVAPAIASLNVSAQDASIEDAARLAAALGVAFNADTKIAGRLSANVHAEGPTNNLAFNGTVNARNLEVTGKALTQAVKVAALDLNLTPQEIRSAPFSFTSGTTALSGQMAISQYTTPSPTVDATLKTVNAKLDELLNIAKAYGVDALKGMSGSGAISLDVHAAGPVKNMDAMSFSGSGAVQNAVLRSPSLAQPVNVRNTNLQFTQNSVNLANINASVGANNISGSLSVANFKAPRLAFALTADKLDVMELERIAGGDKGAPAKRASAAWNLIPTAEAAPAPKPSLLETVIGNGTIAVGSLLYDRTVVSNVKSNVALNHGVVQLSPFSGQVFGGQINGSITADLRNSTSSFAVNAKLSGADANQLLTAVANTKDAVYGTLNATLNQTFSTPASGDVTQTLNGPFAFTLANGKLTKVDLVSELAKIGKFTGQAGAGGKGYTSISSLSGTFDVRNGVANTNDLKGALDVGNLAAAGALNLVNQTLGIHLTAILNKQYSQSVGGNGVGGYLTTALGNKNGELVLPVIIGGTMSHPTVVPDVQKIAEMKLNNIVPGAAGIVGALLGGRQQNAQPGNKQTQPNAQQDQLNQLQDALGGLFGGNKKKPPKQ